MMTTLTTATSNSNNSCSSDIEAACTTEYFYSKDESSVVNEWYDQSGASFGIADPFRPRNNMLPPSSCGSLSSISKTEQLTATTPNESTKETFSSKSVGSINGPITVKEVCDIFNHHSDKTLSFYENSLLKVWPLRLLAFTTAHGLLVWVMCILLAEHFIQSPLAWDSMQSDRDIGDVMAHIRQDEIPKLKDWYREENDAYFSGMQQPLHASSSLLLSHDDSRSCVAEFFEAYSYSTFSGESSQATSIEMIKDALDYYHLNEIPDITQAFSAISFDIDSFLTKTETCLSSNVLLETVACTILDNPVLQKPYSTSSTLPQISLVNLHRALVLNQAASLAIQSPHLKTRIIAHLSGNYYETTRNALLDSDLPEKYIKVLVRQLDLIVLSLKQTSTYPNANSVDVGISTEAVTRSSIAVGGALDMEEGLTSNGKVANLLNAHTNKLATVDNMALSWDLGKDWIDTYVSWNMAFSSRFGSQGGYWSMAIPSVSCEALSSINASDNHFMDAMKMALLMQYIALPQMLASEKPGAYANPALTKTWGDVNLAYSPLPVPARRQMKEYFLSLCKDDIACVEQWDMTYTSPLSLGKLSNADVGLLYTVVMIISTMLAGTALEIFIGVYWASEWFPKYGEHWLHFANCIYSLFIGIAVFSRSILALPYAVLGLWKLGYPETMVCLNRTWLSYDRKDYVALTYNYMNGLGIIMHHLSSIVFILQIDTGRWLYNRGLRNIVVPLVMQHWVVPLMTFFPTIGAILILGLEVMWEWEILAYLQFCDRRDFDMTARGTAFSMILSHWLYIFAFVFEKIHSTMENENDNNKEIALKSTFFQVVQEKDEK